MLYSFTVYYNVNWTIEFLNKHSEISYEISWVKVVLKWCFLVLNSLVIFFGGFLFILGKKVGWYLVIISSIYLSINWMVTALPSNKEVPAYSWLDYTLSLFFLLIAISMLSKPIRAKYRPNKKSLVIVLLVVSALLLFRYVF
ncbi:MAG: hypothetical protein RLZ33_195 [Bacteroidota bacterium]